MKQVYAARHAADAHMVKGLLESEGISATVRGEFLAGGIGELPADVCSVWVLDDALYGRAMTLLNDMWRGRIAARNRLGPWLCPGCGERLEGQFSECWHCGASRPTSDAAQR